MSYLTNLLNDTKEADTPWLMCTTYISNDDTAKAQAAPAKAAAPAHSIQTVDDQVAAIEESFAAAGERPKHPRDPSLRPVQVLPVLPDFRNWMQNYLMVNFDNDPTEDHDRLSKLNPNQRKVTPAAPALPCGQKCACICWCRRARELYRNHQIGLACKL